jgi:GTP-binding protein EngB required for normal cell division
MELNDTKIAVLRQAVESMPYHIESLCNVREDIYEIKRAEWFDKVTGIKEIIERDQMLLFIGPYSSGKSTFVNALLGEVLLPTASKPCTSVVTELSFVTGGGHKGKAVKFDKTEEEMDYDELLKLIDGPRGTVGIVGGYHHIELMFDITQLDDYEKHPLAQLQGMKVRIVDCPGYGSPYITNEDVIEEYIQKASYTFWLSPADKFGGALAERKLSDIKKRTSALIPVITMADKIDAAQKEQVTDDFYEHVGHLFPKKDPRFVSAYKYVEAVQLEKELEKLDSTRSDKSAVTKEEKKRIREKIDILKAEAGLEQIFSDMVKSGQKKNVTDATLKSALHDLYHLLQAMNTDAKKEKRHWDEQLKKEKWTPDDAYNKLNGIKRDVDSWIKAESEHTADGLETSMTKELVAYIMKVSGKLDGQEAQRIIVDVWEKELNRKKDAWAEHLAKAYGAGSVSISVNSTELKPPDLGSITAGFTITIKAVLESLRYAGGQSVAMGGLGAAIFAATGAVQGVALIGGALAAVTAIVGPLLIIVGAVPLIPIILDKRKDRIEQYRKETESKLKAWMKQLNLAPFITVMLNEQHTKLHEEYKLQFDSDLRPLISKHETCEKIINEIQEIHKRISFQFPNEFRG